MSLRASFETRVLAAFTAAVLVVALLAAVTWKVSQDADEAARWVAHTHEVLNNLARARGDTLQIELSTQNYRLTGDPARIAERDAAIAAREAGLRRIRELTADNAGQQARWQRLREVADERLAIARRTAQLRQTQGAEAANAYVASAPVRETRERLFGLLREMQEEEQRLLEVRGAEQARTRQIMVVADALLALLLATLLAATHVLIRRQLRMTEASRRELAVNEQNLATTLHSIGDAVLATDTTGRVTRLNPVAERLTGWAAAEAQGRPVDEVFSIVNEETRAPAEVPVAKVLASGEIQGLANHTLLIARDSSERPIAVSAAPIRDAAGEVSGVVLVFRDVTIERQAERTIREQNALLEQRVKERTAQLRESEERFRLLVADVKDYAIIMLDPQGRVVTWNEGVQRLKGYAEAEIVGQPMERFYPPEDVAAGKTARLLAQAAAEGRCEDEGWRVRQDGTRFYADVILTALRNQAGELVGFAKITRDISERKQAEAQLRMQVAALDSAANAIVITDRDTTIRWVNRAFSTLTGYSAEEVVGQTPKLLNSGMQDAEFYRRMYQTILAGSVWHGELVNRYKGGRLGAEEMTITPLRGDDGAIQHFIAIKQDITERKRAEQEILDLNASLERRVAERTRQLEEANRAKSDFLANMSHELRTPLNAIIGFSEMLKDSMLGEMDARQRDFVADIFDAGTHLLSLINDILDLSKIEAGMLQLDAEAVDVPALLMASTQIVKEKALAHRIRLDTRLDPGLGSMLADARKLKQIVYNLLSNAVKFTPAGGAVKLSARRCTRAEVAFDGAMPARLIALPPGGDEEFLAITVEDTGVGIAETNLAKLFEPFTQVDSSLTRRQGGTGLGLSLVRRLAELHGGTVGVASRPGAGSRFSVWLPYRATVAAGQKGGTAPAVTALSRLAPQVPLALVVEDDDRMADLITTQLRAEGFEVMRAATAEEALVRAAKRKPQLITLDIFLPAMDGWEFMRRLKAEPKLADTAVVIITISPDLERGLALGARRVLHKPFAREELVAALAGLVAARPDGAPARVLVADDNVQAVELVAATLEAEGYRVLRAYGGAEAIEAARSARPDLVILDLMMPGVSGFDVAHALRESEETARIPILVLTAKDLTAEDHDRLNGSVSAILAKASFSRSELLAELRRALPPRAGD
jgi:PAS domain S-box-containing protein